MRGGASSASTEAAKDFNAPVRARCSVSVAAHRGKASVGAIASGSAASKSVQFILNTWRSWSALSLAVFPVGSRDRDEAESGLSLLRNPAPRLLRHNSSHADRTAPQLHGRSQAAPEPRGG